MLATDSAETMESGRAMVGSQFILEVSHFTSFAGIRTGGKEYLGGGVSVGSVWVNLEIPLVVPLPSPL